MRRRLLLAAWLGALLASAPATAQTVLSSTVLQSNIGANTPVALLAHGTSVTAGQVVFVFDAQPEAMLVTAVSAERVTVQRGYGSPASGHQIGALVFYGASSSFASSDQTPGASCTGASVVPSINPVTGHVFQCVSSVWAQVTLAGSPSTGTGPAVFGTTPTITAPVLSGTATGTYTLAGTPTITAPTINAATITGAVTFGTSPSGVTYTARSPTQNVDNGAGTTVDHVLFVPQAAGVVTAARVVYTEETAGTIAAGTWQLGTTVGGTQIVAAVAYTNAATVGTETVGTIVSGAIAAGTPIIFRHTGVAAVAAGVVYVEIDFDFN